MLCLGRTNGLLYTLKTKSKRLIRIFFALSRKPRLEVASNPCRKIFDMIFEGLITLRDKAATTYKNLQAAFKTISNIIISDGLKKVCKAIHTIKSRIDGVLPPPRPQTRLQRVLRKHPVLGGLLFFLAGPKAFSDDRGDMEVPLSIHRYDRTSMTETPRHINVDIRTCMNTINHIGKQTSKYRYLVYTMRIKTYGHKYTDRRIDVSKYTYIRTYLHVHTYIRTYIHTYIRTCAYFSTGLDQKSHLTSLLLLARTGGEHSRTHIANHYNNHHLFIYTGTRHPPLVLNIGSWVSY